MRSRFEGEHPPTEPAGFGRRYSITKAEVTREVHGFAAGHRHRRLATSARFHAGNLSHVNSGAMAWLAAIPRMSSSAGARWNRLAASRIRGSSSISPAVFRKKSGWPST